MSENVKKHNRQKIFIFFLVLIILTILVFFVKNILIDMIKLQVDNDYDGMEAFIRKQGVFGPLAVIIVEALQMVVVFISAEFIQIAAGLSFPWYLALPFCTAGIFTGATIIYLLVNCFKFDGSIFKKSYKKIGEYSSKSVSTQILMYVLFFMPIIPFGAICYYGSSTKISYSRYIITCVTGTIPSIFSSIFLSKAIAYTIAHDIPFIYLVLVIIGVIILLILLSILFLSKTVLKGKKNTPDSLMYNVLMKITNFYSCLKGKPIYDKELLGDLETPFIVLSNHPSTMDISYVSHLFYPVRFAHISNRYYLRKKLPRKVFTRIGIIPKKLFNPDIETIKKTIRSVKNGYSIFMCPEGRLGLDGTNYPITEETGKFVKQLKQPIVLVRIDGAYLMNPKWRKHRIKNNISVAVKKVITKEEVLEMSVSELNQVINDTLAYNDFEYAKANNIIYKDKKKAEGLENVLYYCPKCKKEYTINTNGNTISCSHCGLSIDIDDNYSFKENELNLKNIHTWYELIKEYERNNIRQGFKLECNVTVKKFDMVNYKDDEVGTGVCTLDNDKFTFTGDLKVKSFTIDINNLKALAFSCGKEFECYYNDELYYFYPVLNKEQCCKWALLVDELVKMEK